MLRGFYTAASGMIAQQRVQESLSNNIANVNTPGYKADQTATRSFPELLMHQIGKINNVNGFNSSTNRPIGPLSTGVYVQEMVPNFVQGDLKETGISTDVALVPSGLPDEDGNLFFTVQNEAGEARLTRNGNFTVDYQGRLVTNDGYFVLDQAGNQINTFAMEFTVSQEGVIQLPNGENIPLGITYVTNANELEKEGNGLFRGEGVQAPEDARFSVYQGFLERSNVDAARSMTDMIQAFRLFEINQRVLRAYDESMGKAVNDIARIG